MDQDLETEVTNSFLFLLDMCKDPVDVFPSRSAELRLAQAWLEKLCLLVCNSMSERRLRNKYLSELMACLNNKELKGPFLTNPPETLEDDVNWKKGGPVTYDCRKVASSYERCGQGKTDDKIKGLINCSDDEDEDDDEAKPRKKRSKTKVAGEAAGTSEAGTTGQSGKKAVSYMISETRTTPDYWNLFGDVNAKDSASGKSGNEFREDITALLYAISSELRGDKVAGENDRLECELVRYKEFLLKHSELSTVVMSEGNPYKLRSFLLLNLQNDLIKLLTEK